jgi:hypothetical protein
MGDQQRDVLAPARQRRHLDLHHVDAVVQVLAEAARGRGFLQVVAGGGQHARVDGAWCLGTGRPHGVLLQRPQQFLLQPRRQLADLVEQGGTAIGVFECALVFLAGGRAGAEQLDVQLLLGHARAADHHERSRAARAGLVQGARQQFLAGAALAEDEYAGIGAGHHVCLRKALFHDGAARDDVGAPFLGVASEA